jgi:hypothetical protein
MKQSLFSEANSQSASQEISRIRVITAFRRDRPRSCVIFRKNLVFYGEQLLAPRPTARLEEHPLSAVRDWSFSILTATLVDNYYRTQSGTSFFLSTSLRGVKRLISYPKYQLNAMTRLTRTRKTPNRMKTEPNHSNWGCSWYSSVSHGKCHDSLLLHPSQFVIRNHHFSTPHLTLYNLSSWYSVINWINN